MNIPTTVITILSAAICYVFNGIPTVMDYLTEGHSVSTMQATGRLIRRRTLRFSARRIQVPKARVGIVSIEGKRLVVVEKQLDIGRRNREAESFGEQEFHIRNPNHLALSVEQWSTAISRIDFRRRLNIDLSSKVAIFGSNDPLRH
jgi:hypothetical protein